MRLTSLMGILTISLCGLLTGQSHAQNLQPGLNSPLGKNAQLVDDPVLLRRALARMALTTVADGKTWNPAANEERARGAGQKVYPIVAPATVVVRTGKGHGTGFVIDADGWVVTNHHVIAGAKTDPKTGQRIATVYFGRLKDGFMQVLDKGVPAVVHKSSEQKDLALLKLKQMPAGFKKLPVVKIAKKVPPPGSDCVAIGHPRAGMLWTIRSGEVSGAGTWPREMIKVMMLRLAASASEKQKLETILKNAPTRRVVLSSCGLNPGDSGGPLVNKDGELIAVSFAIPKAQSDRGISLDKFSYHVHLDEFREFVKDRSGDPEVAAPDPWPAAVYRAFVDSNDDGVRDTILFAVNKSDRPVAVMADLDQDGLKKLNASSNPSIRNFDFEFVLHHGPVRRAFYDTDNDGKVDLILTDADGDGTAETEMVLSGSKWAHKQAKTKLIDPSRFKDKALRDSLSKWRYLK